MIKTKLPLGMCILMIFGLLSCHKDDSEINSPVNAKLKQVLLFSKIDSQDPISIVEEYEYDDNGKISKVSSPMYDNGTIVGTISYSKYEYNESSGQLIKIMHYNANLNSPTGFINLKNTSFTYSIDGLKIKETIEFPLGGISENLGFEYQNGLLSRTNKYSGHQLETYTEFDYDKSDRLIKETFYASDGQCISYTIHSYTGSLQTKTDFYISPTNDHFRSINRTFDKNNNIITLESKELSLYSSMMSHVLRYKYYE